MHALPLSFEERISRIRLWILPLVVLTAGFAVDLLGRLCHLSEVADDRAVRLTLYVSAFSWWVLRAAPRPLSVRATLGRGPDLAGWSSVALLLFADTCLVFLYLTIQFCWRLHLKGVTISTIRFPFTMNITLDRGSSTVLDAALRTIVLAPIVEELVFRGTIFRKWRVRIGPGKAALLTTLLFSALHVDYVTAFSAGLTMLMLYAHIRSLAAAMVFHAGCNIVSLLQTYVWPPRLTFQSAWAFGTYLLILVLIAGAWLRFVRRSWPTLGAPLPPDGAGHTRGPSRATGRRQPAQVVVEEVSKSSSETWAS